MMRGIYDACDLRNMDLSEKSYGAHFIKADARGAYFIKAQLAEADFMGQTCAMPIL